MDNDKALIFQLVNNEYLQPSFQDEINLEKFAKFPIGDIAILGTTFSPLAKFISSYNDAYLEALKKTGNNTVYAAQDKVGNAINLTTTVRGEFDGRKIGSLMTHGKTGQARFEGHSLSELTKNTMVLDPTTMMTAAELLYIAKEVNVIQQNQQDMFKYFLIEKQAKIDGSLSFLTKVLNDFKYNFQNQTYRISMHTKVLDVKQEAEQNITASRKHIEHFLNKNKQDYNKLGSELQNYQLALYLYAFSSFVEVIVLENLDKTYLDKVSKRIEEFSIKYREVYTDCYNYLESAAEAALHTRTLEVGSKIANKVANIVAKSPIGDKTLVDEKLIEGADNIQKLRNDSIQKQLIALSNYKDTHVQSFIHVIDAINKISNDNQIFFSQDYIYIPSIS